MRTKRLSAAPEDFDSVPPKGAIGGENRHPLRLSLRDQEAIKGVFMVQGKLRDAQRVAVGNAEDTSYLATLLITLS